MLPELDERTIRTKYAPQFEAHERLQAWVWKRRMSPGSAFEAPHQITLFAIFARATLTYRAIRRLVEGGYWQQAEMLGRSLYEDFVAGLWISLPAHRDEATSMLEEHRSYELLLMRDAYARAGFDFNPPHDDLDALELRRSELEKKLGAHGGRHWLPPLHKAVDEITPLLPDDGTRQLVKAYRQLRQRLGNHQIHTSPFALDHVAEVISEEGEQIHVQLSQSPSDNEEFIVGSLGSSFLSYGWLARHVLVERRHSPEAFDAEFKRLLTMHEALTPSARAKIGRNELCPCASGKKYKSCHGR